MVRRKEEIMALMKGIVDKTASDDDIVALLEDISDTLDAQAAEVSAEEWETRLKELDETWRKKYVDRFFGGEDVEEVTEESDNEMIEEETELSFDKLFKKED